MIFERIPGERFSRVLPAWTGKAAVLLAGGPSLTAEQVEQVRVARETDRIRVIAINDSYLLAPWADVHYAADAKWHRWHTEGIDKPLLRLSAADVRGRWLAFPGEKCSIQAADMAVPDEVHLLRNKHFPVHGTGLSLRGGEIVSGRHSGFQALNIVILAGVKMPILLGYDGRAAADGTTHWHGRHPIGSPASAYEHFRRSFSEAARDIEAAGVRVINCSPCSAIDTFPKRGLAETLASVA